jgi:cyclic pyranopterin phosphate synthase
LFSTTEFDLRAMLRGNATDDELAAEIKRAVGTKWAGHAIGYVTFVRPKRSMSQIGG